MSKHGQNTKKARKAKIQKASQNAQSKRQPEQKTWVLVVRLILVGLLILVLGGSLFFGIFASAYGLPLSVPAAQNASASQHGALQAPQLQPGDVIDGRPAEEYQSVTDDLPAVEAPYAALCTKDGRILFERGIDTPVSMASTTKMMTAIVALEAILV